MSKPVIAETTKDALPILAAAALDGASGGDPQIKQLLTLLLEETLEKRKKERERQLRLAESAVKTAQEQAAAKATTQAKCNHLKQDNRTTRLAGQRLSGTGQLALVCQFCGKEYHLPPGPGQEAPPRELIPPMDEIGG